MKVHSAVFLQSNTDYKRCPPAIKPEYVFIGRSNVGKSSLINMLTDRKHLAKTSQVPGKTQHINHFLINDEWYLVDLPGYGWAKVSKTEKEKWDVMIKLYLTSRENLMCVFVLIDSRLEPQASDLSFMQWLGETGIPFVMVFTKADKQSKTRTLDNVAFYQQRMLEQWEELPPHFITSSVAYEGRDEILGYIEQLNPEYIAPERKRVNKNPLA